MIERTLTFTIDAAGGITPSLPQAAGRQGDHLVTKLVFALPDSWQEGGYVYRVECVDGMGAWDTTALIPMVNGTVSVALPCAWTRAGGQAVVRLVVARSVDGDEVQTVYTADARLLFESRRTVAAEEQQCVRGLSTLLQLTSLAADNAGAAAAAANEAGTRAIGAAAQADAAAADAASYMADLGLRVDNGEFDGLDAMVGVTNVSLTTHSDGSHHYEIALDLSPERRIQPFLAGVELPMSIGEGDYLVFYDAAGAVLYTSPKGTMTSGGHLFCFDGEVMTEIKGAKGDKGDKGEKGDEGVVDPILNDDTGEAYSWRLHIIGSKPALVYTNI